MSLTPEQTMSAFYAFVQGLDENDEAALRSHERLYGDSARILVQNCLVTHRLLGLSGERAIWTNIITGVLFGRYLERLERDDDLLFHTLYDDEHDGTTDIIPYAGGYDAS